MLHAVIMAGGSGTRFWPASRLETPKQLLQLVGDRTMIQATADRLSGLIPPERLMVVTNQRLVTPIRQQLPKVPSDRIIGEPCKRDTAPCVGLAAGILAATDPDALMLVLPADHVIRDINQFQSAIEVGQQLIEADPARIVTFGIRPTEPSSSFGYIESGEVVSTIDRMDAQAVIRFREKPDRETAQRYVDAKTFYWNSGIFLWRAQTILDALATYEPEMHSHIKCISESVGKPEFEQVLADEFAAIKGKSIDYAVMERYQPVLVVEAPFDWDDVGSWQALTRLVPPDSQGNTVQGNHVGIDTNGCIIRSEGDHTIVTIGIEDLIIVRAGNATLVAPKSAEERIREVTKKLEAEQRTDLL